MLAENCPAVISESDIQTKTLPGPGNVRFSAIAAAQRWVLEGSKNWQPWNMDGLRAHTVQQIGQIRGQSGHRIYVGFKGSPGGSGGPLAGHEGGPKSVDDSDDEDPPRGIGTDPEELQNSLQLGRSSGKPREDLLHHGE